MITEYTYAPYRFQHASAVCGIKGGVLAAFYAGSAECHKSQHVCIAYNGQIVEELEEFTGNPVLFQTQDLEAKIIYSKFEKFPFMRVKWWQYCSLWSRAIYIDSQGSLKVSLPTRIEVEYDREGYDGLGFLTRCNPIKIDDTWHLPIYRERQPEFCGGVLASTDGDDWKTGGFIGLNEKNCIQPTFWEDDGRLKCLMRNFNPPSRQRFAYYSEFDKESGCWSDVKDSALDNANNSLVVLKYKNCNLVVWNKDPSGRDNLCLGKLDKSGLNISNYKGTIVKLANYGHYPSMCIIEDKLHILFTTHSSILESFHAKSSIKHKILDLKSLDKLLASRN